jgi:hypothetical protein
MNNTATTAQVRCTGGRSYSGIERPRQQILSVDAPGTSVLSQGCRRRMDMTLGPVNAARGRQTCVTAVRWGI